LEFLLAVLLVELRRVEAVLLALPRRFDLALALPPRFFEPPRFGALPDAGEPPLSTTCG
jgi:hypothetical protein